MPCRPMLVMRGARIALQSKLKPFKIEFNNLVLHECNDMHEPQPSNGEHPWHIAMNVRSAMQHGACVHASVRMSTLHRLLCAPEVT
jgi:hypothetical protein